MAEYFDCPELMTSLPISRAAYSDRMAWILAEMSRLVYEKLPNEAALEGYVALLERAVERGDYQEELRELVKKVAGNKAQSGSIIEGELKRVSFELLDTFSEKGTEALLAKMSVENERFLVLAFRGTQPNVRDILTDIKADLMAVGEGGRAHRGFVTAYRDVRKQITDAVERADAQGALPLYITGHSLGGALALLATRFLECDREKQKKAARAKGQACLPHSQMGATYTFGAPRAADDTFYSKVKTPMYQVMNAADGVARLPFGYVCAWLIYGLRLIPINGTFRLAEFLRKNFCGYTHPGHLVFLSAAENIPDAAGIGFAKLKVKKSPDIFWRMSVVIPRLIITRGRAAVTDHSIQEYSLKLRANAQRRQ
ncbi:MAG: lipase family protein [Desulfovibrio sp.]|uniref:lipase family protein n=1 Tax=Desulfovibrio sp. 7SRBS1 TaxID=3378064 RepID=UPI003B401CD6